MPREIKVGTAGWSYKEWEGIVFPSSVKPPQKLRYFAQFFDLVEINTSFYGVIKTGVGKMWCRKVTEVNPKFVFTAKLNRAFTHSPRTVVEPTSAKTICHTQADEYDAKAGFDSIMNEGRLGAVLAQFPISFKCTEENRTYLERLVSRFRSYPLVIEVRHATWDQSKILHWLTELGVGLCNIDQPIIGHAIRPTTHATSAIGYVRLHGRNYDEWFSKRSLNDRYDYLYTDEELRRWASRAEKIALKTQKTFVVTNNHNFGKAGINALELKRLFDGLKVSVPEPLLAHYPQRQLLS